MVRPRWSIATPSCGISRTQWASAEHDAGPPGGGASGSQRPARRPGPCLWPTRGRPHGDGESRPGGARPSSQDPRPPCVYRPYGTSQVQRQHTRRPATVDHGVPRIGHHSELLGELVSGVSSGVARAGAAPARILVAGTRRHRGQYAGDEGGGPALRQGAGLDLPSRARSGWEDQCPVRRRGSPDDVRHRPGWAGCRLCRWTSRVGECVSPGAHHGLAGRAGPASGHPMTARRDVLLWLATVLAIPGPLACFSEAQPRRLIKIGALTESWGPTPAIVGLRDGLQELGYRENQDFAIGVRFVQGNLAELPEAARALARQGVDVIVTSGGDHSTKAAQQATTQIPIVFLEATDPVGAGFVKSLARPGGNITGTADLGFELVPKGLEIFRELVPRLKRVLLVYDATNDVAVSQLQAYRDATQRLGLKLIERPVRTEDEARAAISAIRKSEVDGIFSPRMLSQNIPGLILEIAPRRGIPSMFEAPFYVERAGLASYGADKQALGRQAARLVDKILKGARPADIPVEQATKFELAINLKAAKALGLTIPPSMLARADRLIQ